MYNPQLRAHNGTPPTKAEIVHGSSLSLLQKPPPSPIRSPKLPDRPHSSSFVPFVLPLNSPPSPPRSFPAIDVYPAFQEARATGAISLVPKGGNDDLYFLK